MFCPQCKNEFQKGILVCPDCGVDLVEEDVNEAPIEVIQFRSKLVNTKFINYLKYCKIPYVEQYDEVCSLYKILGTPDEANNIKRAFVAFLTGEVNINSKGYLVPVKSDDEEEEQINFENDDIQAYPTDEYVDEEYWTEEPELIDADEHDRFLEDLYKEECLSEYVERKFSLQEELAFTSAESKASENLSSGIFFVIFGFMGLAFSTMCLMDLFKIFSSKFPGIVLGVMFIGMVIYGFIMLSRNKEMQEAAQKEDALLDEIKEWQKETITKEVISFYVKEHCDTVMDSQWTEEEQDLLKYECIRKKTLEQYPSLNADMLEHLVDTYMDSLESE